MDWLIKVNDVKLCELFVIIYMCVLNLIYKLIAVKEIIFEMCFFLSITTTKGAINIYGKEQLGRGSNPGSIAFQVSV